MATFEIRLMFEWGGSCLWGMNDAVKTEYGYSEIEKKLPISNEVKNKLASLSKWHDTALDWNDPMGKSPWKRADFEQFESEAQSVLQAIQIELGDMYSVWYRPLGSAD